MVRADKRAFMDNLAMQAEDAADQGEQGTLFRITKALSGKHHGSASAPPIKDKQGRLLTTENEQEARWAEHFQEVLNRLPPEEEADIQDASADLDINTDPPGKEEIVTAIRSLKNRKAPGYDNLNTELFKADPDLAATILQPFFRTIWERKQAPDDWNKGIIVKIPKRGALSDCNNWRRITLLSVPSKILAKVIIQRISDAVDKSLRNEQAGFRRGRGCTDQIFALRNIIEQCTEWQRQLYINFVDFEKAFDSIHRDSLWRILRAYGIPDQIVELIKSFYTNFSCSVGNSDVRFKVKTGVRQGCVMSALLFNLAIDWVMRRTTEDGARGIRWTLFSSLEDFADDLALLSHTHQHMQEKTNRLNTFARQVGLKISQRKTEVMTLNIDSPAPVKVDGKELPTTKSFTYLGSIVRQDGGAGNDIQSRLNKARTVFMTLNNVWRSSQNSVHTKLRIYQSCVLSALLYGSECWRMTEGDLNKLSTFHTTSLRKILRIFWPRKISNHDLLQRCKQEDMDTIITRRRWRWIAHVMRKDCTSISKTALHWTPEGKRKRGRPKNTWRRTVEAELKTLNHTWGTIEKLAKDRQKWMIFVAALHTSRRNRQ
ncbi:endonuclease-reverse transcriptase [Labeo rohita]|uniref:Endonuclease-reverse transcriptase n=1 Tax=Labeo rohita TaxID=84645 RepID=A0A498L9F3_LABRO|nr:endonuclease-reverse transcriptase [Labeo rohita]RXN06980.1 endonuclease-reverse transcriptase [Labeo rohita]